MKKIAIIGASYLQVPLIRKAKDMGLETHVFAWECGDPGEREADHFYPISIREKEEILEKCKAVGINGICSIASDLAVQVVNYVAFHMGLVGNTLHSTEISTNKYKMRQAFVKNGIPCPSFSEVLPEGFKAEDIDINMPVIVKPEDRSGSRGVTKVYKKEELKEAVERAACYGFEKKAIIESYLEGKEYSVECISYKGRHSLLTVTEKYTTGAPHFIETGHMEPAEISEEKLEYMRNTVFRALDALEIEYGASHVELKIDDGSIRIVEIGARMGGDFIGSELVHISTGVDFVKAVIDIAMGNEPVLNRSRKEKCAAIHFITKDSDVECYKRVIKEHPEYLVASDVSNDRDHEVVDSSSRYGYYIMQAEKKADLEPYMPQMM